MVVRVRVRTSLFNGGEQGRLLKGIDRCDIERWILTGGNLRGGFILPILNAVLLAISNGLD